MEAIWRAPAISAVISTDMPRFQGLAANRRTRNSRHHGIVLSSVSSSREATPTRSPSIAARVLVPWALSALSAIAWRNSEAVADRFVPAQYAWSVHHYLSYLFLFAVPTLALLPVLLIARAKLGYPHLLAVMGYCVAQPVGFATLFNFLGIGPPSEYLTRFYWAVDWIFGVAIMAGLLGVLLDVRSIYLNATLGKASRDDNRSS